MRLTGPLLPSPPLPPKDLAQIAADQGYLYLPRLLPPETSAPLRDIARAVLLNLGWTDEIGAPMVPTPRCDAPGFLRLQRATFASDEMDALRRHARLLPILAELIGGEPYPGLGDLVRVRCPGARTRAHQDQHYVGGAVRWTAWMPLEDCPLDRGPIAVIAGSHRWGPQHHDGPGLGEHGIVPEPDGPWLASPMRPGDVVLFSGMLVHGALPTTQPDQLRLSVDFRYGAPRPGGPPPPV